MNEIFPHLVAPLFFALFVTFYMQVPSWYDDEITEKQHAIITLLAATFSTLGIILATCVVEAAISAWNSIHITIQ